MEFQKWSDANSFFFIVFEFYWEEVRMKWPNSDSFFFRAFAFYWEEESFTLYCSMYLFILQVF